MEVDVARKRISLSMKTGKTEPGAKSAQPSKQSFNKPAAKAAPSGKPHHKVERSPAKPDRKANAEGDLQLKLEALKNKFK